MQQGAGGKGALAIEACGMVTSVGLTAAATCAAIRAGVQGLSDTRFVDSERQPVRAGQVRLERPWRGADKIRRMVTLAAQECLSSVVTTNRVPFVACLSDDLDDDAGDGLFDALAAASGVRLDEASSRILRAGRSSIAFALQGARELLFDRGFDHVLVVAGDSLVTRAAIARLEDEDRLLAADNMDGFLPGEAAAAIVVTRPTRESDLVCLGIGAATEVATIASEEPRRAEGLVAAIRAALAEASLAPEDIDVRVTDLSGEHYYFREAALALSRVVRSGRKEIPLWHPAECIGEVGVAVGPILAGVALTSTRKRYAPGANFLLHLADDGGARAALVLQATRSAHGQ
ncbi:MAG TPA: hypothetical protein VGO85_06675 [Caldimonas sp.]|jgi:3-oxoacyl-[acyl-carrier-protein] synthase-1|nr:hypothetical protein [Caldimonas sp.]